MKRVTMPPMPWDADGVTNDQPVILGPAPHHVRKLILEAFTGEIEKSDLLYMARAILQMSDEIFELRERLRCLEMAKDALVSPVKPVL